MNGVSPEDAASSSVSGLGSEKRARFFDLLGVAGGVDMHPDFEAARRVLTVPLFLPAPPGRSSTVVVECFPESAMMRWVGWDDGVQQREGSASPPNKVRKNCPCEEYVREKERRREFMTRT